MASISIIDCRRPGEPMQPVPLKLPAAVVAQLKAHAAHLQTTQTGLLRTLVLNGLADLPDVEQAA